MQSARALGAVLATVLLAPAAILLAPAASAEQRDVLDVRERSSSTLALADMAPGDSSEWAAEVTNTDSVGHALTVGFDSEGPLLTAPDGLRLAVDLCDAPFDSTPLDTPEGRTVERFTCASGDVPLGSGPAAGLGRLETARPIAEGATVGVRVRVAFPESAGNALEDADGSLRVVFSVAGADQPDGPGVGSPGVGSPGVGSPGVGSPGAGGPGASEPGAGGPGADSGVAAPGSPARPGGLAVTGRDLGAALLGALVALAAGLVLTRRRWEDPA